MYRLKLAILSLALALSCLVCRGQFLDAASGLLQAPSADMGESGTVMVTANYLNSHSTPPAWGYNTFNYGFSIVFLPRIEIGYVATYIYKENHPIINEEGELEMVVLKNQDRRIYGKVQLLREGDFGIRWLPALAVGVHDPTTRDQNKRIDIDALDFDVRSGNGFFNRLFVVATKHFPTPVGEFGAHLGYQYNRRDDGRYNGPCAALDWRPVWLQKDQMISTKLIAEYDAKTFNVGLIASLWRDHFDVMVDLQSMRWLSAGVRFKMVLE